MTVKNYTKITSLILLIVPVHWDLLNNGFKCRKATPFETASEPFLLFGASLGLRNDIYP